MLITVKYKNGKTGMVEAHQLTELIGSRKIKEFLRGEGWVTVGIDQVRQIDENYKGHDRRKSFKRGR
jgi:hypothetical protein